MSDYNLELRDFKRHFYACAKELELDSADRLLIPKTLADDVSLKTDLMLFAHEGKIEIWDLEIYNKKYRTNEYDLDTNAQKFLFNNKS